MTYYILKTEVEPTVVGVMHGAGQLKGNPLYEKENAWRDDIFLYSPNKPIDSWKNWVKHELFAPKAIVGQILQKKAKKTDYIGDDGNLMGFYVNHKLKNILESCNLPNHRFITTTIIEEKTGKENNDYYRFVYDMETGEHNVDFAKCEYDLKYHKQKFGDDFDVNIQNYEDYLKVYYETGSAVKVSKLVFNKNFDSELDLFGCQFLTLEKSYISERLKQKIERANITGCKISAVDSGRMLAEILGNKVVELVFTK
jgi:hypothetical protein